MINIKKKISEFLKLNLRNSFEANQWTVLKTDQMDISHAFYSSWFIMPSLMLTSKKLWNVYLILHLYSI